MVPNMWGMVRKMKKLSIRQKAVVATLVVALFVVCVTSDFETNVTIDDINTSASLISVPVTCTPSQSIKAWEFSVSFDQTILQAINVEEGDIFDGYTTFFNSGTIDNTNGTITSIYNLIVGDEMVDTAGSLVVVNFEAISEGTTLVEINNLGITNETEYIPVSVDNGTVVIDISSPTISNISVSHSEPKDTIMGWTNISADIVDEFSVETITIHLLNPDNTWSNTTFYGSLNTTLARGHYSFFIRAVDYAGNVETSEITYLDIPPNWDINMDGIASLFDFVLVSNAYSFVGDYGWIREDADNDGLVDMVDFVVVSIHYNEMW